MIKELLQIKEGYKKLGYGGEFLQQVSIYEYKTNKKIRLELAKEKLFRKRKAKKKA